MRDTVEAFRRPPVVRLPDRNGGFPRLSEGVPHGLRCLASPRHALLAESLGKPSLWVIINAPWYDGAALESPGGWTAARIADRPGAAKQDAVGITEIGHKKTAVAGVGNRLSFQPLGGNNARLAGRL